MASKYEIRIAIIKEINNTISIKNNISSLTRETTAKLKQDSRLVDVNQLDDNIKRLLDMWEEVEADEAADAKEKERKAQEKAAKKAAKQNEVPLSKAKKYETTYKPLTRA